LYRRIIAMLFFSYIVNVSYLLHHNSQ